MSRKAIIADIHANLESLESVLKDIDKQKIDDIILVGDAVGYGANPGECIDLLVKRKGLVALRGNHDHSLITENYDDMWGEPRKSLILTRQSIFNAKKCKKKRDIRIDFLYSLSESYFDETGALYVHGSPRDPIYEYLSSGDYKDYIDNKGNAKEKLDFNFLYFRIICFNGHNHIPGIIIRTDYRRMIKDKQGNPIIFEPGYNFVYPKRLQNDVYEIHEDEKTLVNVGAVGQSRNGDPRASYFIYDNDKMTIECRRIKYNIKKAANKIKRLGLDICSRRLYTGK